MRNSFSENYPQCGHVTSKIFANLVLGRKRSKNIVLKGCQIISLPGEPTCLGLAEGTIWVLFFSLLRHSQSVQPIWLYLCCMIVVVGVD